MSNSVADSPPGAPPRATEPTRRTLSPRQADTVDRLVKAGLAEIRESGFDDLTIRNVARRAGVAPATAYNYFSSREHLVTELFWRRLSARRDPATASGASPLERVTATLRAITTVVADEPELSAACTQAMLGADPEVVLLRYRIGAEMHRRVLQALGDDADPEVVGALEIAISGALLQTGMGYLTYDEMTERLTGTATLLMRGEQ